MTEKSTNYVWRLLRELDTAYKEYCFEFVALKLIFKIYFGLFLIANSLDTDIIKPDLNTAPLSQKNKVKHLNCPNL